MNGALALFLLNQAKELGCLRCTSVGHRGQSLLEQSSARCSPRSAND